MNSRALIQETIKYLDGGSGKYRIEVYKNALNTLANNAISNTGAIGQIAGNAFGFEKAEDDQIPVTIYTIGDVIDTLGTSVSDIQSDISGIKDTLKNMKVSLKQFGLSVLDKSLEVAENAAKDVEIVQNINKIYRVARPLVEKIVDIASIRFHFENAALVAQDILQYLKRTSLSIARTYLDKLWLAVLDTPIFAIYENKLVENYSDSVTRATNAAENAMNGILSDERNFNRTVSSANNGENNGSRVPSYSKTGITIPDEIVDIYHHDKNNTFIASSNEIYSFGYNSRKIEKLYSSDSYDIERIFCCSGEVYFTTATEIRKVTSQENSQLVVTMHAYPVFSDSEDIVYSGKTIYGSCGLSTMHSFENNISCTSYDVNTGDIYVLTSDDRIWKMKNSNSEYEYSEISTDIVDIYSISFFNGKIYAVLNDGSNYIVEKIDGEIDFPETPYSGNSNTIKYIDEELATDGNYIYDVSGSVLSVKCPTGGIKLNNVESIEYNNKDYIVGTYGTNIFVTEYNNDGNSNWIEKSIDSSGTNIEALSNEKVEVAIPDSLSGCVWFDSLYRSLIIYSSENLYLIGPDNINSIFEGARPANESSLSYKETRTFEQWYEYEESEVDIPDIKCSYKLNVGDDNIISSVRAIGSFIYVSLYNINSIKSNIYRLSTSCNEGKYELKIDKSFSYAESDGKIYSFDILDNGNVYYTDGLTYNDYSNGTKSKLYINKEDIETSKENDRTIFISCSGSTHKVYSTKYVFEKDSMNYHSELRSIVKYSGESELSLASTGNVLMISDDRYVYCVTDENNGIDSDLYQICFVRKANSNEFSMIQSRNSIYIVSKNTVLNIPTYSSLTSFDYGCGYYTDTTLNKWFGAAPYYFISNVLKEKKYTLNKTAFLNNFRESFKIELEKLLKNIPDALIKFCEKNIKQQLMKSNININNDDGKILEIIVDSATNNVVYSYATYISALFAEKIGDDSTYDSFSDSVYELILNDANNNMTKDFYDIFKELYFQLINESIMSKNLGSEALRNYIIRYYQNHKNEWADSMMSLIDIDKVTKDTICIPLDSNSYPVKNSTYIYKYANDGTNGYISKYIEDPAKKSENIKYGYLYNGEFYEDEDHTITIDKRKKVGNNFIYENSNRIICYYNPDDGKYYDVMAEDYYRTKDSSVVSGKTYYAISGSNAFEYSLTEDETEISGKTYYAIEKYKTDNIISGKTYYKIQDGTGIYNYTIQTSPLLSLGTYYVSGKYNKTEDYEIIPDKKYYLLSFERCKSSDSPITGRQYYKIEYIKTNDVFPVEGKTYYNFLESAESGSGMFVPYASQSSQRYSRSFTKADVLTENREYYVLDGDGTESGYEFTKVPNPVSSDVGNYYKKQNDIFVHETTFSQTEEYFTKSSSYSKYIPAENTLSDLQYYIVDGMFADNNGTFVFDSDLTFAGGYSKVVTVQPESMNQYYESEFVKVAMPTTVTDEYYISNMSLVSDPIQNDIEEYYEYDDGWFEYEDAEYVLDGSVMKIKNSDSVTLYARSYIQPVYVEIFDPEYVGDRYENRYIPIPQGEAGNPHVLGLFEREYNGYSFVEVENPIQSDIQTYYEYIYGYSIEHSEDNIYIDLSTGYTDGNFDYEDNIWHEWFYDTLDDIKDDVEDYSESHTMQETKEYAYNVLDSINCMMYPSWIWQEIIKSSVNEFYIPIQGEQYRKIVFDSNMYPIQWQELPDEIDHDSFDYALTALLYEIKKRLITNISILVDKGDIKCYSCADADTIISGIVKENSKIRYNQISIIKRKIRNSNNAEDILNSFNIVHTWSDSRDTLKKLLDEQSVLFSKYIDMIIIEQVINDYTTEVEL